MLRKFSPLDYFFNWTAVQIFWRSAHATIWAACCKEKRKSDKRENWREHDDWASTICFDKCVPMILEMDRFQWSSRSHLWTLDSIQRSLLLLTRRSRRRWGHRLQRTLPRRQTEKYSFNSNTEDLITDLDISWYVRILSMKNEYFSRTIGR